MFENFIILRDMGYLFVVQDKINMWFYNVTEVVHIELYEVFQVNEKNLLDLIWLVVLSRLWVKSLATMMLGYVM